MMVRTALSCVNKHKDLKSGLHQNYLQGIDARNLFGIVTYPMRRQSGLNLKSLWTNGVSGNQ